MSDKTIEQLLKLDNGIIPVNYVLLFVRRSKYIMLISTPLRPRDHENHGKKEEMYSYPKFWISHLSSASFLTLSNSSNFPFSSLPITVQ